MQELPNASRGGKGVPQHNGGSGQTGGVEGHDHTLRVFDPLFFGLFGSSDVAGLSSVLNVERSPREWLRGKSVISHLLRSRHMQRSGVNLERRVPDVSCSRRQLHLQTVKPQ
jgi:hypothetical protein